MNEIREVFEDGINYGIALIDIFNISQELVTFRTRLSSTEYCRTDDGERRLDKVKEELGTARESFERSKEVLEELAKKHEGQAPCMAGHIVRYMVEEFPERYEKLMRDYEHYKIIIETKRARGKDNE